MSTSLAPTRTLLGDMVAWFAAKVAEERRGILGVKFEWGTIHQTSPLTVTLDSDPSTQVGAQSLGFIPPVGVRVLTAAAGRRLFVLAAPAQYAFYGAHPDTDGPGAYPVGLTIFSITDTTGTSWPNGFAVVETVRESSARTVQRLTVKGGGGGSAEAGDVWQRTGWDDTTWQPWQHVYTSDDPATVALSSDFVLATTSGADVPGMSVTLTVRSTTERFRVDIACDTASNNSTSTATAWMTINVDGTDDTRQVLLNNAGNVNTRALLSRSYWVTGLSVGSHTVKLRGACTQASAMKLRGTHTTMTVSLDG